MREFELVLLLLAVVVALATLARRLAVPYPIPLVIGGVLLGLLPGLPRFTPNPELIFVVFVPPLVFSSGFFTSFRDFRANRRPIALLAVGLVLVTTAVVAAVAHWLIPGMTWAAACVLGAVVSSTDTVAATAIAERIGLPQRLITVLEGESMMNDAVSLVTYRFAVAAVVTGSFSFARAGGQFVLASAGGILIGLAVGWVATWLYTHLTDAPTAITLSLLVPYAAYLPADRLGLSGVLAVVAAALYTSYRDPQINSSTTRMEGLAVWETMVFVLNGLIFILLGFQLRAVLDVVRDQSATRLITHAAVLVLTVVLVRILWMFPATYIPRLLSRRLRAVDPYPSWRYPTVLAWAGMRGADTLVVALALPLTTASGAPFPERGQIIFLTFAVIVATLVGQGLTLPTLIRLLRLHDDGRGERETAKAYLAAAHAAMARLDELAAVDGAPLPLIQHLRHTHEKRERRYHARYDGATDQRAEDTAESVRRLRREVLAAERQAVIALRNRAVIGDAALREVQHDLDLEESELE